jgi:hypothetical protein
LPGFGYANGIQISKENGDLEGKRETGKKGLEKLESGDAGASTSAMGSLVFC